MQSGIKSTRFSYTFKSLLFFICVTTFSLAQTDTNLKFKTADEKALREAIIKIETSPGATLADDFVYAAKYIDLNGDGNEEVVVWIPEDDMGGTSGYPILILSKMASGYRKIMDIDQGWTPVIALRSKRNGWRDIVIQNGGGGAEWMYFIYKYNGKTYKFAGMKKDPPAGETLIEKNWDGTLFGPVPQ
jgi:hypothetical protein